MDAEAAARAVISSRATVTPQTGDGAVEMLRVFKVAKNSAVKARTQAVNELKGILVNVEPALREALSGLTAHQLVRGCACLDAAPCDGVAGAVVHSLRVLANRIQHLNDEVNDLEKLITDQVRMTAPALLDLCRVGQDAATTLLIAAGDNPDRLAHEAAFAALCGVNPVEMSSGKTQRRRRNRGGNRQTNAALFRVLLTRLRRHPETRDYLQQRTAEGRTNRDIIRCLGATSPVRSTRSSERARPLPFPSRPLQQRLNEHRGIEQAALKCVYMAIMFLDPTGKGQARWTMRWKTALNAFDVTFDGRLSAARQ